MFASFVRQSNFAVRCPRTSTRIGRTKLTVNKVFRPKNNDAVVNLGLDAQFRRVADALYNSMDAVEYKHAIFGLIVLKHISGAFEEPRTAA